MRFHYMKLLFSSWSDEDSRRADEIYTKFGKNVPIILFMIIVGGLLCSILLSTP
jgi:hypothetical protein